jgi:hypothetical protein
VEGDVSFGGQGMDTAEYTVDLPVWTAAVPPAFDDAFVIAVEVKMWG